MTIHLSTLKFKHQRDSQSSSNCKSAVRLIKGLTIILTSSAKSLMIALIPSGRSFTNKRIEESVQEKDLGPGVITHNSQQSKNLSNSIYIYNKLNQVMQLAEHNRKS